LKEKEMRIKYGFVLMLGVMFLVGCQATDYSQNMRVATARAAGGVGAKALLDEIALDKYDATKKLTVTIAQDIKLFCDNGKLADLPFDIVQDKIVEYMKKKDWDAYIPLVTGILAVVEAQRVPTEKLGADNIYLIKSGLDEVIESAQTSKVEWRRPQKKSLIGKKQLPPNSVQLYRK